MHTFPHKPPKALPYKRGHRRLPPSTRDFKNFYDVLGLPFEASQEDIKIAYKELAVVRHPDKGGSTEAFQELSEAYNVLSNVDSRLQYDLNIPPLPPTHLEALQNSIALSMKDVDTASLVTLLVLAITVSVYIFKRLLRSRLPSSSPVARAPSSTIPSQLLSSGRHVSSLVPSELLPLPPDPPLPPTPPRQEGAHAYRKVIPAVDFARVYSAKTGVSLASLREVMSNIATSPATEKYYALKHCNKASRFWKEVWRHRAFQAVLLAVGFNIEESEELGGDPILRLRPFPAGPRLCRLLGLVAQDLSEGGAGGAAAARRSVPAAHGGAGQSPFSPDLISSKIAALVKMGRLELSGATSQEFLDAAAAIESANASQHVKVFELPSSPLLKFPELLPSFPNLRVLNLSRCITLDVLPSFADLGSLQYLSVHSCALSSLPDFHPTSNALESVEAQDNSIVDASTLGDVRGGLVNVDLRGNLLRKEGLGKLFSVERRPWPKLKHFRIEANMLSEDEMMDLQSSLPATGMVSKKGT